MKLLKTALLALLCLCLPFAALCEELALSPLTPVEMPAQGESQVLDLYCGPTQGFYRHNGETLDLGAPYVVFGQYDCWAMAAQGTAESFGLVGWIEAGFLSDLSALELLSFEDGFPAMIEEPAVLTGTPDAGAPAWDVSLEPGTQVTLLAQYGGYVYVQAEIDHVPVRAFIPAACVL